MKKDQTCTHKYKNRANFPLNQLQDFLTCSLAIYFYGMILRHFKDVSTIFTHIFHCWCLTVSGVSVHVSVLRLMVFDEHY